MLVLLIIVALVLGIAGALFLSDATLDVGLIGLGCLVGILARIIQAAEQGQDLEKRLTAMENVMRRFSATKETDD